MRSTETLVSLEPAISILSTLPTPLPNGEIPGNTAWSHTHTIDVASDDMFVETGNGKCRLDLVTISGMLQWQVSKDAFHYYVLEHLPDREAFAGAIVSTEQREGQMICLVFSPKTREINIEFVRLDERHHRAIRNLKLDIRSDKSSA